MKYNYADILETYMIPAEEGFLFTEITEENIAKLGEKRTLVVFTTDDSFEYGGINYKKYMSSYNYSKATSFPIHKYLKYKIGVDGAKCPVIVDELRTLLDDPKNVPCTDDHTVGEIISNILTTCDTYSKNTNTLVIAYLSDTDKFSYACMRNYPIIITQVSMVKSISHKLVSSNAISVKQLKSYYKDFERFSKKIPKSAYIKNMKFDLYHISPNGDIKELLPRHTTKPLRTENIGIPRVSAAPSIDACFRAIGIGSVEREKDKRKTFYVYKLKPNANTRIVKPTKEMVPDQAYTNEYWILDPVPVELLGTIVAYVEETEVCERIRFDTTNMPEDPLITTSWKRTKK